VAIPVSMKLFSLTQFQVVIGHPHQLLGMIQHGKSVSMKAAVTGRQQLFSLQ